jgi:hypothetical protein
MGSEEDFLGITWSVGLGEIVDAERTWLKCREAMWHFHGDI